MSSGRVLVLSLLLIVLAALVYMRVLPHRAQLRAGLIPASWMRPTTLSNEAVLEDGSFNPISPLKAGRAANEASDGAIRVSPAALAGGAAWRSNYKIPLQHVRPQAEAAGFYVYPFADRTSEGVGVEYTYGWQLVGHAALATWTDARLAISPKPPRHWGLVEAAALSEATGGTAGNVQANMQGEKRGTASDLSTDGTTDAAADVAWTARALADPATQGARFIITGRYVFNNTPRMYGLKIWLIDRAAAAHTSADSSILLDLNSESEAAVSSFGVTRFDLLASQQRLAAQKLAEALVARGLAGPHKIYAAHGIDMGRELRQVAALLDAGDGWAAMDGIDRSMQLAAIFPEESAPLQAAAYGLNELNYTLLHDAQRGEAARPSLTAQSNAYAREYALRAFALEQVAAALDTKPAMTRFNLALSRRWLDDVTKPGGPCGEHESDNAPELEGYNRLLLGDRASSHSLIQPLSHPDWFVRALGRTKAGVGFTLGGGSGASSPDGMTWRDRDFDLHGGSAAAMAQIDESKEMQWSIAGEGAALLAAASDAERATGAAETAETEGAIYTKVGAAIGAGAGQLREAAANGDFYSLRTAIYGSAVARWTPLNAAADARHPYFGAIAALADGADMLDGAAALSTPLSRTLYAEPSGYAGFEFTPMERVRFAQRTDHAALHAMAATLIASGAAPDATGQARAALAAYTQLRPDNAAAQMDLIAATRAASAGTEPMPAEIAREVGRAAGAAEAAFSLANAALFNLAQASRAEQLQAAADAYDEAARRRTPFGAASTIAAAKRMGSAAIEQAHAEGAGERPAHAGAISVAAVAEAETIGR